MEEGHRLLRLGGEVGVGVGGLLFGRGQFWS